MKIKLIALAVAGAFATPLAMANGVTIYGQMGVSIDSVDSDNTVGAITGGERRTRVSSNNSRIGFKGTEDLNSDLSAIWQFEYQVQMDQQLYNQNNQANSDSVGQSTLRNTFVGLSSKRMGALTLGTQEAPLKTSTQPLAVFNDTLADYRSVFAKLSTRSDNSVMYTSPSLGGLVIRGIYGARNEAGNGDLSDPRMWGASLVYSGGPFYATLAYEDNKFVNTAVGTVNGLFRCPNGSFVSAATLAAATTTCGGAATQIAPTAAFPADSTFNSKAWRAGFGYTLMGNTKFGLAYERNDAEDGAGNTANDGHAWYGSVSHRFGNVTLAAAYTDRSDTGRGLDDGAKQYTGGVEYAFSKRTSIYGLYTKVKNDSDGSNAIGTATGIATVSTIAGGDASGFSLGMRHSF